MDNKGKAVLSYGDGKTLEMPVYGGTIGPDVIDIRALYGKTGMFTYDPGFLSTASCGSKIPYIDGDAGVLLSLGYPIEQLATHCDFLETCYLLLNGELPNAEQKKSFDWTVTRHTMVPADARRVLSRFSSTMIWPTSTAMVSAMPAAPRSAAQPNPSSRLMAPVTRDRWKAMANSGSIHASLNAGRHRPRNSW